MNRRAFITLLGAGAAPSSLLGPLVARAQQPTSIPVIGLLFSEASKVVADRLRLFRQGLKEFGYVEGENVAIEYRFGEGRINRLPELVSQLVHRKVAAIVALSTSSALAAKAATTTIPIVFASGLDPVRLGLVTNFARPEGNVTGISFVASELEAKRLELLRELVPRAVRVAVLVNPADSELTETTLRDVSAAARAMRLQIQILNVSDSREIDAAFATFVRDRPDALFAGGGALFASRRVQLANLAARHVLPSAFGHREIAEAGALMSYGSDIADAWRQAGAYAGRILKGARPLELPVVQTSKFELVINTQTAKMLNLTVPDNLLAIADEVIE